MIFSTQTQLNCLLIFIFFGIITGIISSILNIIFLKNYQKKLINYLFDSVFCAIFCIFFVILLNFYNFGKFSIILLCAFYGGKIWMNHTLKNLVVILENSWYNKIKKDFKHMLSIFKKTSTKDKAQKDEITSKS